MVVVVVVLALVVLVLGPVIWTACRRRLRTAPEAPTQLYDWAAEGDYLPSHQVQVELVSADSFCAQVRFHTGHVVGPTLSLFPGDTLTIPATLELRVTP